MRARFLLALAGTMAIWIHSIALADDAIEDAIKYRQGGFAFTSWNMGRIKAQVIEGTVPYDQAQVVAAANAIAAFANSGLGALFPPGSDKGTGFHKTRLKPFFFEDLEKVAERVENFKSAANELARVAAVGDQDAIRDAFGTLGKTCKACHDNYRAKQ